MVVQQVLQRRYFTVDILNHGPFVNSPLLSVKQRSVFLITFHRGFAADFPVTVIVKIEYMFPNLTTAPQNGESLTRSCMKKSGFRYNFLLQ